MYKVSEFRGTHIGQQDFVEKQIKAKNKKEGEAEDYLQTYSQKSKEHPEHYWTT